MQAAGVWDPTTGRDKHNSTNLSLNRNEMSIAGATINSFRGQLSELAYPKTGPSLQAAHPRLTKRQGKYPALAVLGEHQPLAKELVVTGLLPNE